MRKAVSRRIIIVALAAALLCAAAGFPVFAAPGLSDDPVVTKSYVDNVFMPPLVNYARLRISEVAAASFSGITDLNTRINAMKNDPASIAELLLPEIDAKRIRYGDSKIVPLTRGQTITCGDGTMIWVSNGTVNCFGTTIDFTDGKELPSGSQAAPLHRLLFLDNGGIKTITAATVVVSGYYTIAQAPKAQYNDLADALNAMGLFAGTGGDYELDRPATRVEMLVMLVKLLGENDAAMSYTGSHPFTDVPEWANPYVGYAYSKGYTSGTGASSFSPLQTATSAQYTTFLLKALGYDSNSDFSWSESVDFAQQLRFITTSEVKMLKKTFNRDQMVYQSWYVLFNVSKGTSTRLLDKLISSGQVSQAQADASVASVTRERS